MSARHSAVTATRRRGRSTGPSSVLRSLASSSGLLVRRRAGRDAWLLLACTALVALSALLAVAGPRSVLETVDGGARDSVEAAGLRSVVDIRAAVGDATASSSAIPMTPTADFLALAATVQAHLPPALASVHESTTVSLVTAPARLLMRNDTLETTLDDDGEVQLQIARLTAEESDTVEIVRGRLPAAQGTRADSSVEVVLSQAVADAISVDVGDRLTVMAPWGLVPVGTQLGTNLQVVGIVAPVAQDAPLWEAIPDTWRPVHQDARSDRAAYTRGTLLAADDGMAALGSVLGAPGTGIIRLRVDPAAFTTRVAAEVAAELDALRVNTSVLAGDTRTPLSLRTELGDALRAYPPQARAALAQMSVVIAGVVGVAAVVMVLLSRLLVIRRGAVIALERARGASVPAIALRLTAEWVPIAALGGAAGIAAAAWVVPGALNDLLPVGVVVTVAVLAAPVQGAWLARRAWTGRREPANRQDRAQLAKRRTVRRLVLESGALVLALAAAFALRTRGLLQVTTEGTDPFLAAAPLLLAIAVTVLLLRAYPWPIRVVGVLGRRTRGVLGLLGAVRAQRAVAVLPLLALTLGAAVAVAGGLLVDTVRTGQVEASWERVGADIRVDAELTREQVAAIAEQPGVTAVGSAHVADSVSFDAGTGSALVTLVAVDRQYVDLLAATPFTSDVDVASLAALADTSAVDGKIPVVTGATLARRVGNSAAMYFGPEYVRVALAGATDYEPIGFFDGPFVFADLDTLSARMPDGLNATSTLVAGPGAAQAVASVGAPPGSVVSRAEWLAARRGLALHDGVEQMMIFAVIASGLLCVVALIATVLAGARERGLALSMLRTLGMRPRLGWWLALAELAPVVIAAVVGGVAAGVAIVVLLAPALGLDVLAGGLGIPDPTISPVVIAGLAVTAALLLVLAAGVEVLAHRRDRLSDVLRVGETA